MKRALLLVLLLLAGTIPASAQSVCNGCLSTRNNLAEIAAGGAGAQTAAMTNLGIPNAAIVAGVANGYTQVLADVGICNAVQTTVTALSAHVDTSIANYSPPPQATTGVQGLVLAGPISGGVAAFDASGFADVAAGPLAYDPYPTTHLAIAAAGTTQGTATQLTAEFSVVNSGGGGGVVLSAASSGIPATVVNTTNVAITVYPSGSDTIGGQASVLLPGGWTGSWFPVTSALWQPWSTGVPQDGTLVTRTGVINNGSTTVPAGITTMELDPTANIANYNLTLPAAPYDGFSLTVLCGATITNLTLTANIGQVIRPSSGAVLTGTCSATFTGGARVHYNTSQAAWFPG